jgi:succinoglycan biosynthesis transport protein ExoP
VRQAQITIHDLLSIYRRRKMYLFIPTVVVTILSAVGALIMSNKYESSTTILVQRDEILNPLISYQMAVAMASEDRLRTFNEIIFSHTMLEKLRDSVFREEEEDPDVEVDLQAQLEGLRKRITIERRGSDSFRITFVSNDATKCQAAVNLLADQFIQTILTVEGQRNEATVKFFQDKLDELKAKFEASQQRVVSSLRARVNVLPQDSKELYTRLEAVQMQISDFDTRISVYKEKLEELKLFPAALGTPNGMQTLYEMQRSNIPFAEDLKIQLVKYDDITRKYKGKYPEVLRTEEQLSDLLVRIQKAIETEIHKQEPTRWDLEKKRAALVEELKQASISQKLDQDLESDYVVYQKLYDEMKVKLEQAITSRDLGRNASNQFIIIDPPLVPTVPTQPNRPMVILGGFAVGLFLGFLIVIFKELLDTTIRSPRDIETYQKPVIAFIAESTEHGKN